MDSVFCSIFFILQTLKVVWRSMLKSKQPFVKINPLYLIRCCHHTFRIRNLYLAEFSINRMSCATESRTFQFTSHWTTFLSSLKIVMPGFLIHMKKTKACTIAMDTIKDITQSSDAKNRSNLILERLLKLAEGTSRKGMTLRLEIVDYLLKKKSISTAMLWAY